MPEGDKNTRKLTYEDSGVSIDAGDLAVEMIRESVKSTYTSGVIGDPGSFAGYFRGSFPDIADPILVSSTDSVGSKVLFAVQAGKIDTIGIDCVAMCVNDIICCGAKPLFFLDYIGCAKNIPENIADMVEGVAAGCRQSGCALIGGEMAEIPAMYSGKDFDLVGFTVGVVDKSKVIDGSKIQAGDTLIGLPSSGIHSNGYSLVRKIIELKGFDINHDIPPLPGPLIDHILEPTKIYVKTVLDLLDNFEIHGIVHITGGGFTENIPRILPEGLGVKIDKSSWEIPPIFEALKEWGNVDEKEMCRVFNMGIGMVLIVPGSTSDPIIKHMNSGGTKSLKIGVVISGPKVVVYN